MTIKRFSCTLNMVEFLNIQRPEAAYPLPPFFNNPLAQTAQIRFFALP